MFCPRGEVKMRAEDSVCDIVAKSSGGGLMKRDLDEIQWGTSNSGLTLIYPGSRRPCPSSLIGPEFKFPRTRPSRQQVYQADSSSTAHYVIHSSSTTSSSNLDPRSYCAMGSGPLASARSRTSTESPFSKKVLIAGVRYPTGRNRQKVF